MVAIKLRPVGKKGQISYRVVVTKKRSKLKGRFIEDLGWVNRHNDQFEVNKERANYWLGVGAQPTDTVHNLLVSAGVIEGKKRAVHSKKKKSEEEIEAEKKAESAKAESSKESEIEKSKETEESKPVESPAEDSTEEVVNEEKEDNEETADLSADKADAEDSGESKEEKE
ncbi:MAG: 30S ribosomal protein S16 [Candidatus Paceibacterota bacterium]